MSEGEKMIIGITGTIGSGKSTVSAYIESKGYPVYDTDAFTHQYYEIEGALYGWLLDEFGSEILFDDETVDRKTLAKIVFDNPLLLEKLEKKVFNQVQLDIESIIKTHQSPVFFEVPLLYEAKMQALFDKTICVDASPEIRHQRLLDKGFSLSQIIAREKRQFDAETKKKLSDYVVYNNASVDDLQDQLESVLKEVI